jgi:1-acyl-sn-glycerol-3-phosphate acyltransferase
LKEGALLLYRLGHFVFGIVYRVFYRRRVYGREFLPQQGPLIICANHIHWQDPLAIGSALPLHYEIKFMAKEELFRNPIAAFVLQKMGAFSVDRQKADYGAIRRSFQILNEGGVLGLFPEGSRGKPGQLQRAQKGAALIAGRSGAPVLPVLVVGPYRIGRPLKIIIGPVFNLPELEYNNKEEKKVQLEEGCRIIMDNLQMLYPADNNA